MALFWFAQQAGTKAGPVISEGWAVALIVAGYVLAVGEAWWFNADDPATPWDENEVLWTPCDGGGGGVDPGWPYPD